MTKMYLEHDDRFVQTSPSGSKTEFDVVELNRSEETVIAKDTDGKEASFDLEQLEDALFTDGRVDDGYKYEFSTG